MKIVKLSQAQFDNYSETHKLRNYCQTSMYGNLMSKFGYKSQYIGFINNENKLIGASLIISKVVFMGNKIAYAPHGLLFDYEDEEITKELSIQLKKYLGKQSIMLLRIDPYLPISIRDSEGNIMNFNNKANQIIDNIQNAGFIYKGKNLYFETEKPRWEALILLQRDTREIASKMDKNIRNKIRRANNSGIEIFKDSKNDITKLYSFIGKKEKKPISYYKEIINQYKDNIDIFYAKINTQDFLINTRQNYEKEVILNDTIAEKIQDMSLDEKEKRQYLNKKMESDRLVATYKNNLLQATHLLRTNPNGIIISGIMVLKYDNAAYIITEGVNEKYGYLNSNYLLKWQLINIYNSQNFKYLNLNAIVGEFENKNKYSGLNESKLGFNSTVTEYIGEFDIILNNFNYNLYKKFNKNK